MLVKAKNKASSVLVHTVLFVLHFSAAEDGTWARQGFRIQCLPRLSLSSFFHLYIYTYIYIYIYIYTHICMHINIYRSEGFHARERQKGLVRAIVEGDLFLSARSSFFFFLSFSPRFRALKSKFS